MSSVPLATPLLLSVEQAAQSAGISRSYLYELLAADAIRSIKVGRRRLVELDSLKQWQASFVANAGLTLSIAQERTR